MAEVIIPDHYGLATLSWNLNGKVNPVTCTLGFLLFEDTITDTEAANSISSCFDAAGMYCDPDTMGDDWTFNDVEVKCMRSGVLTAGSTTRGPYGGAGGVTAYPPINCSFLVQKKSASVGRTKRGRMYIPNLAIPETAVDNMGNVSSDSVWAILQGQWAGTEAALLALADTIPVVLHSAIGETPTPITAFPIQRRMATQRRRMRR